MKVFILVLFSLIFSVNSEDAKPAQSVLEPVYPLYKDNNYYGNQGNRYYGNQGYLVNEENKRNGEKNNNRNEGRPSQPYGYNNYGYGREYEYNNRKNVPDGPERIGYYARDPEGRRFYSNKRNYQYRLIGRVGLGFDKRTASAYSYLAPITPERLELVGRRPFQLNNNGYNYQKLNLYPSYVGKNV